MPNHVMNKMWISGDPKLIDELLLKVTTGESEFDFNGIIPMPKSLDIEEGSRTDKGESLYRDFLALIEKGVGMYEAEAIITNGDEEKTKTLELGRTAISNKHLYGARSWYDWCIRNWGTKWNAYDITVDRDEPDQVRICFCTAWTEPYPIFFELNEQYPDLDIYVEFANEDLGNDCGYFQNGDLYEPEGNAVMYAAEVWGYTEEEVREWYGDDIFKE